MLFEDDRGEERRLEAVRTPVPDHAAKTAKRRAAPGLGVVGEPVQVALNGRRRTKPGEESSLPGGERRA